MPKSPAGAETCRHDLCHHQYHHGRQHATRLLRRVDGVELPVAGTWTVDGNHGAVDFSVRRRLRRPTSRVGRTRQATLAFSDDPGQVLVAVLFDAPDLQLPRSRAAVTGAPIHLEARSVPGPHRWSLSGEVFTDSVSCRCARRSTTTGCGVAATTATAGSAWPERSTRLRATRRRRLRFSFDLLAHGPDLAPRPVPARSPFVRTASPTSSAA